MNEETFEGILHDTQTGYFAFSFSIPDHSSKKYLETVEKVAMPEGWKEIGKQENSRVFAFVGNVNMKPGPGDDVVYLEYSSATNRVLFVEMSAGQWGNRKSRYLYNDVIETVTHEKWSFTEGK